MNIYECVNIVYLNVCGLKTRLCFPIFLHFINQYDILCFVETKLDDIDKIDIPGYILYTNNRYLKSCVKSGGICLAVRNNLTTQMLYLTQWFCPFFYMVAKFVDSKMCH